MSEAQPSPAGLPRLQAMDGLRGLSCLMVLWCHGNEIKLVAFNPYIGICALKLFFALSGFLIGLHYFPGGRTWRYWAAFVIRRFFRIYPAYALAMFTFWALFEAGFSMPLFGGFDTRQLVDQLLMKGGIMTYWSNVLEMRFYLLFPFVCLPFLWCRPRACVALAVVGMAWLALLVGVDDPRTNQSVVEKLPCFIGGLWAALLWRRLPNPGRLWNAGLWLCMGLVALASQRELPGPGMEWLRVDWVLSLLGVATVLCAAMATGRTEKMFSHRAIVFVGLISYSLYVTHRIVFGLSRLLPPLNMAWSVAILLVEFLVAYGVHRWVEKPFIGLGKRLAGGVQGNA